MTANMLPGTPAEIANRQQEFDALCAQLWPQPAAKDDDRVQSCLDAMLAMRLVDHNDGSHRLYAACCRR